MNIDDKWSEILKLISDDMEQDAKEFDGKPFDGETVGEYLGNQGAAIAVLANIVDSLISELNKKEISDR